VKTKYRRKRLPYREEASRYRRRRRSPSREESGNVGDIHDKKNTLPQSTKLQTPYIDFNFVENSNKTESTTAVTCQHETRAPLNSRLSFFFFFLVGKKIYFLFYEMYFYLFFISFLHKGKIAVSIIYRLVGLYSPYPVLNILVRIL
jgi:hypothetical protein